MIMSPFCSLALKRNHENDSVVELIPVGSCWDFSSYGHVQVWSPGHERAQAAVNPKFSSLRIVKYNSSNNYFVTGYNFQRPMHTKCQTLCGLP